MAWTHGVVGEQPVQPHCGLQWTSMVKRAAFVLLASANSLHTPLSWVSCTFRSAPAVPVWKEWPGRFDLNLTAWEAEMLVLFSMSDIVGQVYVRDICPHSAYGWTAKTAADYATRKFGSGLLPHGIPPFLQPVCSAAEPQKNVCLKCTISPLEASSFCQQKQRSLMQNCAFTFASYSVFLLLGNIELFRYAVGVVPLPHPLNSLRACGDAEAGDYFILLCHWQILSILSLLTEFELWILFVCLLVDAAARKHSIVLY